MKGCLSIGGTRENRHIPAILCHRMLELFNFAEIMEEMADERRLTRANLALNDRD